MAKYRPIKTSFWQDDWIASLEAEEKLLFLYLLTNPHTNLCGIYMISIRYLAFETGLNEAKVLECLNRFSADDKVHYKDGWIKIVNHEKHQSNSPKIKQGIKRELSEIPQHIAEMAYPIHTVSMPIDKPVLKPLLKPILKPQPSSEPSQKQIPRKFGEDSHEFKLSEMLYDRILEFNPKFKKPNLGKWSEHIDKMIRLDGRTTREIEAVIYWATQDSFWQSNILSTKKLRIQFDRLWMKAKSSLAAAKANEIPKF